jgi:predicted O-methyltransferase YrrM
VCNLFDNDPIDFLFIDGDHTYEGVKADFRDYASLVRPGGVIAFHDILPRPDLPNIQVNRFWSEVREKYDTRELIGPEGSGRKIGIGLIRMVASGLSDIG